jgi:hypothetical protein
MKKLLLMMLIVFISMISFAQIHGKVVLGRQDHQRHYVHHNYYVHHRYEQHNYYPRRRYEQHNYYPRRHYSHGSHVVIKARL